MSHKLVVIDACCMLNLLATKREADIVRAADLRLLDTPQVSTEPKHLLSPPDEDGSRIKSPASTTALRDVGLLETRALEEEAVVDAFVAAAARIKDTDASCIAVAGVLGLPLLTDDAKARRIACEMFPSIELISTLDVLHAASGRLGWSPSELRAVAMALFWGGNFAPPKRDPRSPWYKGLLQSS